jgi:hypothetical protein
MGGVDVDNVLIINPAVFYVDAGAPRAISEERAYHSRTR